MSANTALRHASKRDINCSPHAAYSSGVKSHLLIHPLAIAYAERPQVEARDEIAVAIATVVIFFDWLLTTLQALPRIPHVAVELFNRASRFLLACELLVPFDQGILKIQDARLPIACSLEPGCHRLDTIGYRLVRIHRAQPEMAFKCGSVLCVMVTDNLTRQGIAAVLAPA